MVNDGGTEATITHLRDMGFDYRKIGIALDIPRGKMHNYCKTKGIDGYAKRLIEKKACREEGAEDF